LTLICATSFAGPTPLNSLPAFNASTSLLLFNLQNAAHEPFSKSTIPGNASTTAPHSGPSSGNTSSLKFSDHKLVKSASFGRRDVLSLSDQPSFRSTFIR